MMVHTTQRHIVMHLGIYMPWVRHIFPDDERKGRVHGITIT